MPGCGWAGRMTPGCAPSTPASQEPAVVSSLPSWNSLVSSPRYQMLPAASCAYQSNVSSTTSPSSDTTSWTTRASMPAIVLVLSVTVTSVRSLVPSASVSAYTQVVPGTIGQYGLSISLVNVAGPSWTGSLPCGSAPAAGADSVGVPASAAVPAGASGRPFPDLYPSEQAAMPRTTTTATTLAINGLWCRLRLLTRTSSTRHRGRGDRPRDPLSAT